MNQQYRICANLLKSDLDIEPMPALQLLLVAITSNAEPQVVANSVWIGDAGTNLTTRHRRG